MAEAQTTPFTGRTAWGRNLAAPVRDFLSTETGSAATTGVATRRRSRSSPIANSRLASRPTTKKKRTIRPWLTHSRRLSEIPDPPIWIDSFVVHSDS